MNTKKFLSLILSIIIFLTIIPLQTNAASIKLNKTSLNLQYKEGYYLKVSNAKKITWTSTNYNIAFVSREGFVRAKGIGTATIKAKCGNKILKCKVKVTKKKFKTYNLTDKQLRFITNVCYREQGTKKGTAAEASLMANLFESNRGNKYGKGGTGLYNYVKNSGWFGEIKNLKSAPKGYTTIVKKVLEKGLRTLPEYVDEHDCISDIKKIRLNGKVVSKCKKKNYKQHKTKITNVYGAEYFFYSFPESPSDPFGYLSNYKKNTMGDFCYSYNQL